MEVTKKIHVRETRGWHTNWRWAMVWLTQLIFYGLPWLLWGGRQAVLFDLDNQKFFIFGLVLWPHDLIYLSLWLVICALLLFLSTTIVSRVWCGFACPHTIYTEIFLWIERQIEGGRSAQMRLDRAPVTPEKFRKKFLKHSIWILIASWTGLTFVGYFTPIRDLLPALLTESVPPWVLLWMFAYGSLTYVNAGWMREQVCRMICPYSRFQGAMLDEDTLVMTYDETRGEPRGLRNRKQSARDRGRGDCVDCTLCVQVCPVGVDIRQGFQHECTGCGACADACNLVMEKIGVPRGLIRFARNDLGAGSRSGLQLWWRTIFRLRVLIYVGAIIVISVLLVSSLGFRVPLKLEIARERGALGNETYFGGVENTYRIHLLNADARSQWFRIEVAGLPRISLSGADLVWVSGYSSSSIMVRVRLPGDHVGIGASPIFFRVRSVADENLHVTEKAVFFVPRPSNSSP